MLRLTGFLLEAWASQLPPEAVTFVATQLATKVPHLLDYGARQQTHSYHFLAVLWHLGFCKWEPLDANWLEPWLVERVLEHDGDRVLPAMTCLKLHQAHVVLPAIDMLERLVGGISDLATQETCRRLAPLLTDEIRQQLDALLPEAGRQLTRHRWLEQPTTVSNPAAIVTALDRLWYLNGLGVASWDVSGLHSDRQNVWPCPPAHPPSISIGASLKKWTLRVSTLVLWPGCSRYCPPTGPASSVWMAKSCVVPRPGRCTWSRP